MKKIYIILFLEIFIYCSVEAQINREEAVLITKNFRIKWVLDKGKKEFSIGLVKDGRVLGCVPLERQYAVLYSRDFPDTTSRSLINPVGKTKFPEDEYIVIKRNVREATTAVSMNEAGEEISFQPDLSAKSDHHVQFKKETNDFSLFSSWTVEDGSKDCIKVSLVLKAKRDGYYSVESPKVISAEQQQLDWGLIPGYFQGRHLSDNLITSYLYGQGIPGYPVVVRERTATTLASIATLKNGLTIAAVPAPGLGRNPWDSVIHQRDWNVGLSLLSRDKRISPAVYFPILGQPSSYMRAGEEKAFDVYFVLGSEGWYQSYSYVINSLYSIKDFLDLKVASESLTDRLFGLYKYISNDKLSMWRVEAYNGTKIGAQSYLGGVLGAERDAMKNADYGAMWMLTKVTGDESLSDSRLQYALNFKIQQQFDTGFFKGAPKGQYFLWKSKRFTEEWGDHVEPIALTYYNLMDVGNMLLFEPDNAKLKTTLRNGADWLLARMSKQGSWPVAYDHHKYNPLFEDLKDLRPTFYGLIIAYNLLKDKKYLNAAIKGANWFVENAVKNGAFIGVCGDARFAPDFATAQAAQALLDLYDITKKKKFLDAAIETARIYTTYIFTHPKADKSAVYVDGKPLQNWQISQVGLNIEHGGAMGSANPRGPILLSSFSGMFVRFYELTGDDLYLNMARAAALGREAFVNPRTKVASYYWFNMDLGAGSFPHHAWWQIGWIMDYLLSEAALRSNGAVHFPSGFMTPKVGPHKTYGFQPGKFFGKDYSLFLIPGYVKTSNASIDYITALNPSERKVYIVFMNSSSHSQSYSFELSAKTINKMVFKTPKGIRLITGKNGDVKTAVAQDEEITIPGFGLDIIQVSY